MKSIFFVTILATMAGLAAAQFYPSDNHSVIAVPQPYTGQFLFGDELHSRALEESTFGIAAGSSVRFFSVTPEPMATMNISIAERFTTVPLPTVTVLSSNSRGGLNCVHDESPSDSTTFSFTAASSPTVRLTVN